MKIVSEDSTIVNRRIDEKYVQIKIEVGRIYCLAPLKPMRKQDRQNEGRIVEVLGFTDNFAPAGVIVKYLDNNRRGLASPIDLLPHKTSDIQDELNNLTKVLNLEVKFLEQGQEEGEFTCPFCEGKAFYKVFSHPLRGDLKKKRIVSQCLNGCFS